MPAFAPLSDVRVLDLSRLVPGPYGTAQLASLGAEVVKVEDPFRGDYLRSEDAEGDTLWNLSHYFDMLNKNKKSVTLNLKTDEGREAFYRLAADADAVVESFRPGVVDRLEIDYDTLTEHNSEIVYCSVSGYGQEGPYRDRSGHDINYLAVSGVLGLNGRTGERPVVPGTAIADLATGSFLATSLLAALRGDRGQYIDLSLADVATTWTVPHIHHLFRGGTPPERGGTRFQRYPSYAIYGAADGGDVAVGAVEHKFWENLCEALDRPEYVEKHRSEDAAVREAIREDLQSIFAEHDREHWIEFFEGRDVPVSPVNDLREVPEHEYVRARDLVVETEYGRDFRFPAVFGDDLDEFRSPPPEHGEDTEDLLREAGYAPDEIEALRDADAL